MKCILQEIRFFTFGFNYMLQPWQLEKFDAIMLPWHRGTPFPCLIRITRV